MSDITQLLTKMTSGLLDEIDRLRKRIADLERDGERLDWLDKNTK